MRKRVFISIGSNIGERAGNCDRAIGAITQGHKISLIKKSSFYETRPWGKAGQPDFINCVIEVETSRPPIRLLLFLKAIEKDMGRTPSSGRWGPRVIDLDIIFYGDEIIDREGLKIPHPLAHKRGFVMTPLCEIAPSLIHPGLGRNVCELMDLLTDRGDVRKMGER
ncbi:MAG: 2-amino-4-hydroxy-6-hydroxymethyldihydropteridine diphosphokinase [Deltaproteobacteria bacterium]|nr:2-amino-4-hydroxy-6-hydroxymethyldihydropteridine diphosphokinase [Deltaproteobacteria bacterium]